MKCFFIATETKVRDYESRILISLSLLSLSKSDDIKIFIGERKAILSILNKDRYKYIKSFVYLALGVDQQSLFYENLIKKNGIFTSLEKLKSSRAKSFEFEKRMRKADELRAERRKLLEDISSIIKK